jgi:succinate dehydrogenase / fumarate reductase, membrane anchor subunit
MGSGTGIGRVRGLGSARGGTQHWIVQRFTAIGNILLVGWLLGSLALLPSHDHATVTGWLGQPLVAVPMMVMLVNVFWHLRLGLQVLIEDYVHDEGLKFASFVLLNFYVVGAVALGLFSVARIAFAGSIAG